jgi:CDP-4-dehydro-6-deoxyglucose reductase
MPDPKFTKPWHGVSRDKIKWNPTVIEDACIDCGTCVTGCSRLVYRFDFERKKAVVIDPLNCMVGCTTCANTCPAHAITFPPIESVLALEGLATVRHAVEDDLLARRDVLGAAFSIPHADRIVTLMVMEAEHIGTEMLRVRLAPVTIGECFCEFVPGQYIELWQPDAPSMSRAYSIANTPDGNPGVELHIRRVEGGRFTNWAFSQMKIGDHIQARGPLGNFTMRSLPQTPLVSEVCSLWIPSRHIGVFIRWRVWCVGAEGRAGFFCVMHGRRWPLAGPRGGRRVLAAAAAW